MIGKRELGRLPGKSVVVNMARGGIIDERARSPHSKPTSCAVQSSTCSRRTARRRLIRCARRTCCSRRTLAPTPWKRSATCRATCAWPCVMRCCGTISRAPSTWPVGRATGATAARHARRASRRGRGTRRARRSGHARRYAARAAREVPISPVAPALLLVGRGGRVLEGVLETDRLNLINARALAEARGLELHGGRQLNSVTRAPSKSRSPAACSSSP
jgi:D-3-phosphoglycerate dehydrogenase / 2-oxoglutarate reductase